MGGAARQLRAQISEELNVLGFEELSSIGGDLVEYEVKPNFRELGKRYAKDTPKVAKAITSADPAASCTRCAPAPPRSRPTGSARCRSPRTT